jgi:hypothetical protein
MKEGSLTGLFPIDLDHHPQIIQGEIRDGGEDEDEWPIVTRASAFFR